MIKFRMVTYMGELRVLKGQSRPWF